MNRAIELVHNLIYEHETSNFQTDYDAAIETLAEDAEAGFNEAYDVGRYEALKEVLRMLQQLK